MYKKNNTMAEHKKCAHKHPTEIERNDEQLSIIYVRKRMPKIIQNSIVKQQILNTTDSVNVQRKKILKHNKFKIIRCVNQQINLHVNEGPYLNRKNMFSTPTINYSNNEYKKHSSRAKSWTYFSSLNNNYFKTNFFVYLFPKMKYQHLEYPSLYHHSSFKPSWKIYRCQLNTHEESCCCSCNSDAMFEVMKSLYDCYKKKNCDNCNCILCGHLPREERRLGELRKSGVSLVEQKKRKKSKQKIKQKVSLKGKSLAEKEQLLKDLIASGAPLPEPKTKSDKELIKKVQAELGYPQEVKLISREKLPKTKISELVTPLDTKKIPSDKMHKLKEAGLLTPLEGKSSEQKEKILKGLAMNGIPLPKGKTASEKKIIDKVRKDVGLPPEPKTALDKKKYDEAMSKGLITPLQGKSALEKEKILKGQADLGLTLPEGRTASEKKLIAKINATKAEPLDLKVPSAKLQKSKFEGILTPLQGKSAEEKENIIKDLAMKGIPLPEGKTASEKKLINKVRAEIGLPPQPKTPSTKEKYTKAMAAGLIVPLEGKTDTQKEKILREQAKIGLPLPEGRTASERALVAKVKAEIQKPSEIPIAADKIQEAKGAGVITPLQGKTPEQKEKILRDMVTRKIPLPEAKTASEKQIIDKVRKDVGLPPEPKSKKEKNKYKQAVEAGFITPLEGKSLSQKQKILQGQADLGLELPEGRSPSEKALIKKIKSAKKKLRKKASVGGELPPDKRKKLDEKTLKVLKEGKGPSDECICGLIAPEFEKISKESKVLQSLKKPSEKLTKTGEIQTPQQKEKILKELAKQGAPLPEAKTVSEKKILEKVQADLGLPPVPTTPSLKEKYVKAQKAGIITPLEGKTPSQKEKILTKQAEMGIALPEGRTPSEKALVNKIRATVKPETGVLTPLQGKSPEEKKRILRNIVKAGLPLPEGKTLSEKQIIKKVKDDMGLPSKGIPSEIFRKAKAAGLITPLEGKTPFEKEKILKDRAAIGLPLPEGVTPSDKALIKKIKTSPGYTSPKLSPEKILKSKTAGVVTPLEGKTPSQREKMLVGRTPSQKEKILRNIAKQGLSLPVPKTASEKALIDKVQAEAKMSPDMKPFSAKLKLAKAAGLLTPLEGKTPEQKEKILKGLAKAGIPLPEGKSSSEKKLIEKVRDEVGLPPEPKTSLMKNKMKQAQLAGIITPLEGKTPSEKEKILRKMHEAGIPLPKGRTASEKSLIKKIKADVATKSKKASSIRLDKAKAAGLLTPLEGKTTAQKEKIIRDLAKSGLPLPEGKTPSEKAIINKIKAEKIHKMPPEKIEKLDKKTAKIMKEGKGPSDECICGLLTPVPDTALLELKKPSLKSVPPEKLRKTKTADLLASLSGKTPEQIEKKLKDLALQGIPLPEGKTPSEKKVINKIRADIGLPPEPKTPSLKEKYNRGMAAGIITPLQGKSKAQKEKILSEQARMGLPLPEGRTPSEKELIAKIKAAPLPPLSKIHIPSEKVSKARVPGKVPSLEGKSPEEKEKILRDLAIQGIPFPEAKSSSEKKLMDKVRVDIGLPPEPKTPQEKEKYKKAIAAGIITPLQGKSASQKEKILRGQAQMGLDLPKPRTSSEKALIDKIRKTIPTSEMPKSTEKIRKSQVPSLLTPLEGKTSKQKEQILKGLAMQGIPLPEPKTVSEKKLIDKVRADVGLPPEPKTPSIKEKYAKAKAEGLITPLQGKTAAQKEKILRGQAKLGLPLPEGRTPSEKALISKIKETAPSAKRDLTKPTLPTEKPVMPPDKIAKLDKKTAKVMKEKKGPSDECICQILSPKTDKEGVVASAVKAISKKSAELYKIPSEKLRKAKDAGLLTPLQGKSLAQKEKILKGLAKQGLPLPEAKTASEQKLIDKVRSEIGLPPEPRTKSVRKIYDKAMADGYITPLEGKSEAQKERILRKQAELGLPLPKGRTPSEKKLISRIKQKVPPPSEAKVPAPLTSLEGKSLKEKEKILKNLAEAGLPLPEGKTASEKSLIRKVKSEYAKQEKKGKIKSKSKKIGVASGKRVGLTKGAITEEFQDIIKTTTCDRGCGCDKKKIRFKHSYVKIRVTSPDISSLCPCPEECVPGVKGGIFTDNEGIKVTVGRVTGTPSFSSKKSFDDNTNVKINKPYLNPSYKSLSGTSFNSSHQTTSTPQEYCDKIYYIRSNILYNSKSMTEMNSCYQYSSIKHSFSCNSIDNWNKFLGNNGTLENLVSLRNHCSYSILSQEFLETDTSTNASFESIHLLNRNSSVSLVTVPDSISVFSFSTTGSSSVGSFYKIKKDLYLYNVNTNYGMSTRQESINSFSAVDSIRCNTFRNYECCHEKLSAIMTRCKNYVKHDLSWFGNNKSKTCNLTELHNSNKEESNIFVDELSNSIGVQQLIYRMLSKRRLNTTSSLIIVISTSSDEQSSQFSLRTSSSTIGIELFENNCNWNYKANSLHHLHQNQRGFKITATGKSLRKTVISPLGNRCRSTNAQHENDDERDSIIKDYSNNKQKHQTLNTPKKKYRMFSTDTTQDRPCCCEVKEDKLLVSPNSCQSRMDSIVTELVTPILLKEADAQGLDHKAYVNSSKNKVICLTRLPTSHSNYGIDRHCKIPCCHHSTQICDSSSLNDTNFNNIIKTCNCDPEKLKEYFDKKTEEIISKACNTSNNDSLVKNDSKKKQTLSGAYNSTNLFCESCGSSNRGEQICKKKMKVCPCEQHKQKPSTENDIEDRFTDSDISPKNHCKCKDQKRFKKIICECPEEPEPEIDLTEWIDERQIRKLKSDLTQTISGFKINKPRKKDNWDNSDIEMRFENALKYIAENLENNNNKYNNDDCSCNGNLRLNLKNDSVDCECPEDSIPVAETEQASEEEPFTGIKFHISGKGSESKGLNGILCFELLSNLPKETRVHQQDHNKTFDQPDSI